MGRLFNILYKTIVPDTTLSLGRYEGAAVISGNAGALRFSIPTGRVYPTGTTISRVTFNVVGRASNSNGGGVYIIEKVGEAAGWAPFDSSTDFVFQNGSDQTKTLLKENIYISLHGGTNVFVNLDSSTNQFFGGTNTSYINNNAAVVELDNITIYFNVPQ